MKYRKKPIVEFIQWNDTNMTEHLIARIESPFYYDDKNSSRVKISVPSGRYYNVGLLDCDPVGDGEHLIMRPEWKYYQEELEIAKRLKGK